MNILSMVAKPRNARKHFSANLTPETSYGFVCVNMGLVERKLREFFTTVLTRFLCLESLSCTFSEVVNEEYGICLFSANNFVTNRTVI